MINQFWSNSVFSQTLSVWLILQIIMKKLHIPNKLTQLVLPFVFQPPPKIPDKQLDEREHTIEEWKGNSHQILRDEAKRASGFLC